MIHTQDQAPSGGQQISAAVEHKPSQPGKSGRPGEGALLRSAYYLLKPYLPWRLRVALRRLRAKRRRRQFSETWPIDMRCATRPPRWPGWPEGKSFAFVLTHDVEGAKGVARCRELAQLEQDAGFVSAFNFIPEGEYRVSRELRDHLAEQGFEIGVHDLRHDGRLYRSEEGFRENAERINRYLREWNAVGFRSGFMHHNLDWIRQLTVLYDASTFDTDPFEPQPDGAQTIFPFWVGGQRGHDGYVELPYTLVQDFTAFIILRERTIDVWRRKLDWIAEQGGMALINVHPDYVNFTGSPGNGEFPEARYRELLEYVRHQHGDRCWTALPREVATYAARHKAALRQEIFA